MGQPEQDRETDRPARPDERPADEGAAHRRPSRDPVVVAKVAVGLLLLILFVVFVVQNSQPVEVNLVFVTTRIRLIWVFLGCALIGALVGYLLGRPGRRATRKYIRELEHRLGERR